MISYLNRVSVFLIIGYQKIISPFLSNSCRFYPSCSEYAKLTFLRLPFYRALFISAYRLLRCHPWSKSDCIDLAPEIYTKRKG